MCKPKEKRIEQKVAQDINHHRNQHIKQDNRMSLSKIRAKKY